MKLIRNVVAAGLLVGAACAVACSGQTTSPAGTGGSNVGATGVTTGSGIGSVHVNLNIGGTTTTLTSVNWTISGGPGGSYTGTDVIGAAQSLEFVTGGILAGCGYTLSVTGADSNGDPCVGTTGSFCVTAGATTSESLAITCTVPADASTAAIVDSGSVAVDANVSIVNQGAYACPGISSFSISPAEVTGAQTAGLSLVTTGNPAGTVNWTATPNCTSGTVGGFLGADGGPANGSTVNAFSCGSCVGQVTLTAQAQLDVVPLGQDAATNVCNGVQFTSMSNSIFCEGGGTTACFLPTHACPLADGGTVCIDYNSATVDPNNCGACGVTCTSPAVCTHQANGTNACVQPLPSACTSSPCASSGPNSVKCTGNTSGVCTATEAYFVNLDISKNHLTAAGQLNANTSCYACMVQKTCLDDNTFGDTGLECGDVTAPTLDGEPAPQSCLDIISCMTTSSPDCVGANPPVACFCGSASGTACLTAGAANGPCLQKEINGLGVGTCSNTYPSPENCTEGDPTASQMAITNTANAAGMANTVVGCAFQNCESQCAL